MEPAQRLVPAAGAFRPPTSAPGVWTLVENALAGLKPATRRAYGEDLAAFASWLGAPGVAAACATFTALPHGDANALAFEYRSELVKRKLSPSTVNRAMAAIKFVTRMARLGGRIAWELEIPSIRVETYRDTLGPGRASVADIVRELETRDDALSSRNLAIIALLFTQGLRRGEVAALDLEHLDPGRGRVSILGKGRSGREWVTLARGTCDYLDRWLARRGTSPGPLLGS